ncbi:MAG: hypothetical protein ACRD32_02785 [Nitrososphaerales archaeon]
MDIKKRKNEIRKHVWDELESKDIATFPRPVHGRIPNFRGADVAARKLTELDEFKKAKTLKVNPDAPQRPKVSDLMRKEAVGNATATP